MGTLTFDREPKPPLKVSGVIYVPGMRKNLISISALEDRWYEILFRRGHVLIYLRGTLADSDRVIGVCHAKVYKFSFQPLLALSSRASSLELCDIGTAGWGTCIMEPRGHCGRSLQGCQISVLITLIHAEDVLWAGLPNPLFPAVTTDRLGCLILFISM